MRSSLPTVRQLEILLAVARTHNFSRAAEAVGMSQSALSQAIAQMEYLLDVTLVHRTQRAVTLTPAGQTFVQRAETIVGDLQAAVREAKADSDPAHGRVVLTCLSSVILRVLPPIAKAFRARFPTATLVVREADPDVCIKQVKTETADFAIAMLMSSEPTVHFEPIIHDRFRFVCNHDHPLAGREVIEWPELAGYDFVGMHHWSGVRQLADGVMPSGHTFRRTIYEVSRVPTVLNIVEEADAVSAIPALALAHSKAASRVYHCPIVSPMIPRTLGLVSRRDKPVSPTAEAFRELIWETIESHDVLRFPDITFAERKA